MKRKIFACDAKAAVKRFRAFIAQHPVQRIRKAAFRALIEEGRE